MPKSKGKAQVMVPRQRLFKAHDRREVYVPYPHNKRKRECEVWRRPRTIDNSSISINNVWLVDDLKHNLLSISQFCDNGYDVMFDKTNCTVINKNNKSIIFKGNRMDNVYKINCSELVDQKVVCLQSVNDKK